MNLNNLSAKKICRLVSAGMVFSMLVITGIFGGIMQDIRIFIVGGTLTLCAFFWIWLLVLIFGKRLSHFTSNLCRTLDNMIDGNEELQKSNDSETLFARINHRLIRLYEIMQKNRHKVDMERQELQMLISDISHQVKTPVSNLQMVTDTLLTKPVSEEERMDFLQGIRSQTDKLDFLYNRNYYLFHIRLSPYSREILLLIFSIASEAIYFIRMFRLLSVEISALTVPAAKSLLYTHRHRPSFIL